MPLGQQEGPVGMVICPSRELATQTYEIADMYCKVRPYRGPPVPYPYLLAAPVPSK